MKRSYWGVLALSFILLLNIVFTQLVVHQFFYENYWTTLVYAACNLLLFPAALIIYKKERDRGAEHENK
ncbi:hypothetical protein [Halobacillus sp. Marseille-Q1614]|uniref:hypothetical protein n=1 Tax=Halobacillus sp. Marseille-Q1614 TaxID=2709134 RepID=UPI00156E38BD|nr:hypothetical protein [Halobacillus sp. Marseille-Q1614]